MCVCACAFERACIHPERDVIHVPADQMAAIEARIASDEAERIAREALGLSCTFSDDEDDGGQVCHTRQRLSVLVSCVLLLSLHCPK